MLVLRKEKEGEENILGGALSLASLSFPALAALNLTNDAKIVNYKSFLPGKKGRPLEW